MNDLEKAHMKMACVIEASKLKQNEATTNDLKGKSVVEIAKELVSFVLDE